MPDLAGIAAELYALPPADFTAARNARAKQARADGDRDLAAAVQALRRPTVAAWLVNTLVRERPDEVEELLGLGDRLRAAQAARAGQQLRELVRGQHELMAGLRRHAATLAADAGQTLTDTVAVQVEGTLRAAMTDPDAQAAVRSGLLTGDLQSTGFGPVEVGDAVALAGAPAVLVPGRPRPPAGEQPPPPPPPTPTAARTRTARAAGGTGDQAPDRAPDRTGRLERQAREEGLRRAAQAREDAARRARREAAEQDVALAEAAATEAEAALRAARDTADHLTRRHAELSAEIDGLTARLHELEALRTTTGRDERRADAAREAAARAADAARRRARSARRRLDGLG